MSKKKIDPDDKLRMVLEAAIEEYAQNAGTDFPGAFRDALTDLKHLADEKGINFEESVEDAAKVAAEETEKDVAEAVPAPLKEGQEAYYFHFEKEYGGMFGIVQKEFWDKHKSMNENVRKSNVKDLPEGFWESMEAYFKYAGPLKEGIAKLLAAGFIPRP